MKYTARTTVTLELEYGELFQLRSYLTNYLKECMSQDPGPTEQYVRDLDTLVDTLDDADRTSRR